MGMSLLFSVDVSTRSGVCLYKSINVVITREIETFKHDKLCLLLRLSKSAMLSNSRPLNLYTPINS
jgi:hypothetical protein